MRSAPAPAEANIKMACRLANEKRTKGVPEQKNTKVPYPALYSDANVQSVLPTTGSPLAGILRRATSAVSSTPTGIIRGLTASFDTAIVAVRVVAVRVVVVRVVAGVIVEILALSKRLLASNLGMSELLTIRALNLAPFELLDMLP